MPGGSFRPSTPAPDTFYDNIADTMGDGVWPSTYFERCFLAKSVAQIAACLEATAISAARSFKSLEGKSLLSEGRVCTNASRDVHRKLHKMGYSIPVPIETMNHASENPDVYALTTYHIKPESWIQYLMAEEPPLLGGWNNSTEANFEAFWKAFQVEHPSHEIFNFHGDRLSTVIPVLLHGDEGRAVKRTNYLVMSMESPIGSLRDPTLKCHCRRDLAERSGLPGYGTDLGTLSPETSELCRQQMTNYKGHSYLSHFLLFGVGGWMYKKHPHVMYG